MFPRASKLNLLMLFAASQSLAATITVNTLTDELNSNGNCSLREAVQAADTNTAVDGCSAGGAADTIVLPAGTYVLNKTGANEDANQTGDLDITTNVTITAATGASVTIDANLTDRHFDVSPVGTLTLQGLTLINGRAPNGFLGTNGSRGGAIQATGPLTLTACNVSNNAAGRGVDASSNPTSGGIGGALFSSAALTVTDCTFTNNTAGAGGNATSPGPGTFGGQGGSGGAISSRGPTTIVNSTFGSNAAGAGGSTSGGPGGSGGTGGALSHNTSPLAVSQSTFLSNSGGLGSGIKNHGGGIEATSSAVTIQTSTFSLNEGQLGSAVFVTTGSGKVINSTFLSNVASFRGAVALNASTLYVGHDTFFDNRGGGVAVQGNSTMTLRGSIVAGNRDPMNTAFQECVVFTPGSDFVNSSFSLLGVSGGCTPSGTDTSVSPALVSTTVLRPALAANGGPTKTLDLVDRGPAVDTGTCSDGAGGTVTTDQRGYARPAGTNCDVGAVEFSPIVRLQRRSVEPVGANCAAGGQRFEEGLDDGSGGGSPGDGVLQAGEISTTWFVCNGVSAAQTLIKQSPEPAGANCASGGARVDSGLDDGAGGGVAADGTLQAGEVRATSYVCNGAAGHAALVKLTVLTTGDANCANGGTKVEVGNDANDDTVLQSTEVSSTSFVCNGAAGTNGANGTNGTNGVDGAAGAQGTTGPMGPAGEAGKSGCSAVGLEFLPLALVALLGRRRRAP